MLERVRYSTKLCWTVIYWHSQTAMFITVDACIHIHLFQDWSHPNSFIKQISFVDRSNYYTILQEWLKYFPLEQILVLDGDLLVKDPLKEVKRTEEFLGVQHYLNSSWFEFVKEKNFYCIKNAPNGRPRCLGDSKGRPHPVIDPLVKKRLQQYYKPYNEKLFALIGRRFDW